jgi:hypothetical protein
MATKLNSRLSAVSLELIQHLAAQACGANGDIVAFAGISRAQPGPSGMGVIVGKGGSGGLGYAGGLTLIKSAAAFAAPAFKTRNVAVRESGTVRHFAEVQQTTSNDVAHDSYYPAAGDHIRPGMTQRLGSHTYTYYWRVSLQVSQLIRQGEEEHLADLERAYELTYKLIADTINSLVGVRFGPANTPAEADRLAEEELARKLPPQLGTEPRNWVAVLDRLLHQTEERDRKGWHTIGTGPPQTEKNKIVHPVIMGPSTRIGVPSSEVVTY